MRSKLLYLTDLYCCWCYGFGKTMNMVADEYGSRVDIHVVNGGMVPRDIPLQTLFSSFADPVALHERISSLSGQVFGKAYLDHLRTLSTSTRLANSLVPARAMHAMKSLTRASELQVFAEFQHAYYRDGLDITQMSTYRHLASTLMVDSYEFERAFVDPASQAAVKEELTMIRHLAVGGLGYPTLLLQDERGYTAVARGYTAFRDVRNVLDRVLSEPIAAGEVGGSNFCNMDGRGCS